jgi:hypothetical protein
VALAHLLVAVVAAAAEEMGLLAWEDSLRLMLAMRAIQGL